LYILNGYEYDRVFKLKYKIIVRIVQNVPLTTYQCFPSVVLDINQRVALSQSFCLTYLSVYIYRMRFHVFFMNNTFTNRFRSRSIYLGI